MRRLSLRLLGGLAWVGLVGCGDGAIELAQVDARLQQTQTCADLLDAIQDDARAKVDLQVKAIEDDRGYGGFAQDAGVGLDEPVPGAAEGDDANAPSGFSDTNTQVAGVDEADIVKVGDGGRKLYVLRGEGLHVFESWPAAQTSKVADVAIEGYPIEMFVDDSRAAVFSSVNGIDELDTERPCDYGYGPDIGAPAVIDDAEFIGPYYCGRSYVKLTVVDLDATPITATREQYVEGYYGSSRKHGNAVRAIVQSSVYQPGSVPDFWSFLYEHTQGAYPDQATRVDFAHTWAGIAKAAIAETELGDWLPLMATRTGDELQVQAEQCSNFHVPAPGLVNYGLTRVFGIDLRHNDEATVTSIMGSAYPIYSSRDALVLAHPDYAWFERGSDRDRTALHLFEVSDDSARTRYVASGFVDGSLHDQFSIDERAGVIRVATTRTRWTRQPAPDTWVPPVTDNLVTTLEPRAGALEVLGTTPALAEGERIFSARFVGDVGYLVTFRQVDPLFAIDLSDPSQPRVLGELKIPGFSDYMHPLDDDHLLTIGRDIDEPTQQDRGVALQIFDVSDPSRPALAHKALVGNGYSEANYNHKAFNYYADKGVLSFPFVSWQGGFSSTLELWSVKVNGGLQRLGAVDHSSLVTETCGDKWPGSSGGATAEPDFFEDSCGYLPDVTRGVFIDDYIYSISHGGVLVHDLTNLVDPVATATY